MRALILIAGVLALAACGNNDQTDNTQNVDENLTAENIVSNDVTAIDAVTGDAANMAAESEVNDIGLANAGNSDTTTSPKKAAASTPAKHPAPTSAPSKNTTDTASNATANGAD